MATNNTLYINLPVLSLPSSIAFYTSLGFTQNLEYSDSNAAMLSLSPETSSTPMNLMLLTHDFFKTFLGDKRQLCEARKYAQVLLCVSMPSREAVDEMLERVKTAKGETGVTKGVEMPGMYGGSFADLDGHVFELVHSTWNCEKRQLCEAKKYAQVLLCVSMPSREAVDEM